jgi:hypothetical protein
VRRSRARTTGGLRRVNHPHRIGLGGHGTINTARFESALAAQGGTTTWRRYFYQTQGSSGMGDIETAAAAGFKVYVSFRPTGTAGESAWADVAAGNQDARWADIGGFLATIPNAGAWCFNHEPENDGSTSPNLFGSAAKGASFIAAWERVASIIKPLAPAWQASICLFQEVFASYEFGRGGNWDASPDPDDWMSPDMDLLGVDMYSFRGSADGGSEWATNTWVTDHQTAMEEFLTYAASYGVPLCCPEFGYAIKDPAVAPTDVDNQIAWFSDFAASWAGNPAITFITYFEINREDIGTIPNWSITDDDQPPTNASAVAAFASIGA